MNASLIGGRPLVVLWRAAIRTRRVAATLALTFALGLVFSSRATDPPPSARTIETLTVRGTTYTRVTIVDISKRHVSFRSAQGFATVLLDDLEPAALNQLGRGTLNLDATERAVKPAPAVAKNGGSTPVNAREKAEAQPEEDCESGDDDCVSAPIQWTARNVIGLGVLGLGALAICVGHIWFICAGFHTSVLWGVVLLIGGILGDIMFCVGHWEAARRPTYLQLAGIAFIVGGWSLFVR